VDRALQNAGSDHMSRTDERGFSLLETLVAVSVVAVALASLTQLVAISVHAGARARRSSMASVLAQEKLEALWSLGAALVSQPATSLDVNPPGLCDFLDEHGRSLGTGSTPPAGAVYVRRWSITPVSADPAASFLLQVAVAPRVAHGVSLPSGADPRHFGGALLMAIRARRVG
jgi:prepilin-type N-terminal cleavage/methylation domain-containing protein